LLFSDFLVVILREAEDLLSRLSVSHRHPSHSERTLRMAFLQGVIALVLIVIFGVAVALAAALAAAITGAAALAVTVAVAAALFVAVILALAFAIALFRRRNRSARLA
jgi:uncharacterized membrane protein YdbT with pleckstrin-like domain